MLLRGLPRVVVTGVGLVTPLGVGRDATWFALLAGESGVGRNPAWRTAETETGKEKEKEKEGGDGALRMPTALAAMVPEEELQSAMWKWEVPSERTASRFIQLGMVAAAEALQHAGLLVETDGKEGGGGSALHECYAPREVGVAVGSGIGSLQEIVQAHDLIQQGSLRRISPHFVPKILQNMAAGNISIRYGLQGPNHAAVTACATGAHAIGDAANLIRMGHAKCMLAGATEASIHPVAVAGFSRMRALASGFEDTPKEASRPFDAGRSGFVLGEGAAVLVLEELTAARARGAHVIAELEGYGLSGDAFHATAAAEDARGAVHCMQQAMQTCEYPENIAFVNAHATSTPLGDAIEVRALRKVFADAPRDVLVSSTKGATGHLLGAAGAVEAAVTVMGLYNGGLVPPTLNLTEPLDPEVAGAEEQSRLRFVRGNAVQATEVGEDMEEDRHRLRALSNSFGFGGTNASLLFAQPPRFS